MLTNLILKDFRNHTIKDIVFKNKQTVFVGNNGRGKTNILEAISVLSTGKSWREKNGTDLIYHQKPSAIIQSNFENCQIKLVIEENSRKLLYDNKKTSFKKHLGRLPTILFAPEHLHIFKGLKKERQTFFDRFLIQIYPNYLNHLRRANKANQQKNKLLKEFREDLNFAEILPWNQILAESIIEVWKTRQDFLKQIFPILQTELETISQNKDKIEIKLQTAENFFSLEKTEILDFYKTNFFREKLIGKNLLAPSRDDFAFFYREKPILVTASRGEERSILIALLVSEKNLWQNIFKKNPILLLDDCFSELDDDRQNSLGKLCDKSQVFFTTTHKEHFSKFAKNLNIFEI